MQKEKWKNIIGFEDLYLIGDKGSLIHIQSKSSNPLFRKERTIKPNILNNGYHQVRLFKNGIYKAFKIHRLVAAAFVPNPENLPYINHKDGNKGNNEAPNLEWCTPKQNTHHAIKLGKMSNGVGENNHNCKLSKNQVSEIRTLFKEGITVVELSNQYKVSGSHITNIIKNKKWIDL